MTRHETYQPDFHTLPEVAGVPGVRWMGTTMMTEADYLHEGWHVRTVGGYDYWVAALPDHAPGVFPDRGIEAWAAKRQQERRQDRERILQRVAAAQDRDEEHEASWGAFHAEPRRSPSPYGDRR